MARTDENPYDPPVLPDIEGVIQGMGGYPQPQWPDDVILPDNKDRMEDQPPVDAAPEQPVPIPPPLPGHIPRPESQPEPEETETSQSDELDSELLAQNSLIDKAQQLAGKIEAVFDERQLGSEIGADAAAALSAASGDIERSGGLGGQFREAIEALRENESILEARTDEVHDAETVPTEGHDGGIGSTSKDAFHALGEIGGKVQAAIESVEHEHVVETQADDVYEAEAAPVEASDDSDPYGTDS